MNTLLVICTVNDKPQRNQSLRAINENVDVFHPTRVMTPVLVGHHLGLELRLRSLQSSQRLFCIMEESDHSVVTALLAAYLQLLIMVMLSDPWPARYAVCADPN